MNADYLSQMTSFTESNLPDLDEVVLATLQFLCNINLPKIDTTRFKHPLIVGSVNALSTGKVIFSNVDAVFAEESNYSETLQRVLGIDAVYIISASGGKHAVHIAKDLSSRQIPVFLITSSATAPAAAFLSPENVYVFPHIREPYTYNTSTYMAMMLGASDESPSEILSFIEASIMPAVPNNLNAYNSFILTLPPEYGVLRGMFETKFDELFGSKIFGRSFTTEELKHAKTVVPSDTECIVAFGQPEQSDAPRTLSIPLPENCGFVAMLAIGYFVIGHIQKQNHPYFKENILEYTQHASALFGQTISVIVE